MLILLLLSLLVVLQVPSVQTRIARFATEKLESVFNARMEIGSIEIHPFNAITVHDAVLIDPSPYSEGIREMGFDAPVDTIARIGKLSATVSLKGLFHKRGLNFGRVKAEDLLFQFASEPGDYGSNLVRVLNLVSDGKESKMSMDSIFTVKHLEVKNARFRLINYVSPSHYDFGMNWGDLDVHFNLRGHDIGFFGGRMHGTAEMLTAEEKSGFKVLGLSGKCHVGQGKTILENLHLRDGSGSDIRFSSGVLSYSGSRDWGNFINAVDMDIHFQPSTLVLESIAYFSSGTFKDTKFITDIHSGHLKGTVSNFLAENLDLSTPYGPYGLFNVSMKGLPKIQQTLLDADISGLHVSSAGLQKALAALGAKANLSKLARGEAFVLDGKFSGPMNQLHGNARIASRMGRLGILADVNNVVNSKKDIEFNADLTADSFDLGKLLGTESLGSTSFTAKAGGSLGGGNTALNLEELNIGRLMALGYEYKDLLLKGSFVNNDINAAFSSGDPNALLDLEGFYNLDHNSARLNADLKYVDLAALKLDTRGGTSKVSCGISADRGIWENAPANVLITDLVLTGDQGALDLGDIVAEARLKDKHLTALLNSNFVDIKYNGPSDVQNLVKFTRSISSDRDMPAFFLSGTHEDSPEAQRVDATLSAVFHDTENFLAFLMPGMAIAPDTTLNIDISEDGTMLGYLSSPYLAFNKLNVSDLVMAIDNQDETLSCTVNTDVFKVNDLSFNKACITIEADDNLATMGVNYEGADVLDGGSDFNIEASLKKDENGKASIDLQTLQSNLRIKSEVWRLRKSNIGIHNGELFIDGFRMASDRQSIAIDGRISPFRKDSLLVSLNNVDLGILNEFLKETFPRLNGIANGRVTLLSPLPSEMGLGADLSLKDIVVKDKRMGDFALNSSWNDTGKSLSFNLVNTLDEATVLSAEGSYGVKDKKVDGTVVMNGFNVGFAAPFLHEYLTELDGKLNGTIYASGRADRLSLTSEDLNLDNVRTRVSYTNVAYTLNGPLTVDENGLTFKNINVTDDYDGRGVLAGGINFKYLKDFNMNAALRMFKLKAIDIPTDESRIRVYGDLAISGTGKISGPFNALYVDADVSTSGSGNVNVPLSVSSTAQGNELLTFVQPYDGVDGDAVEKDSNASGKASSMFSAHARVNLSSDVMAHVEIDKDSGHVLTAGGSGQVLFDMNTAKDKLQLKGDYNIDKGKYLFNIPGVVSKEFDIKSGSVIKLNGDIKESTLDINAVHNVKTSLATLVADTTSVSSRRNVECGINISGKIVNPDVSFSIDVPDLDPNTKMSVESALSTNDKIQKQFVSLLLFGTFLPEEGSGVVNGTNMIASNVGEIVSSQLNNILQKLDIPLDFGLGYQQDNVGTDIFDLAVSTQLFNNRVLVNGSVGNRKYSTSKSSYGDLVGDLDIEIKMDRKGELRFKLFSHSADEFSSSLDFTQRNGFGVSYQKEFDRTKDFFRQLFLDRRKRAEEEYKAIARKREMTIISIE